MSEGKMPNVFFHYLTFNGAELFTMVCLPEDKGTFPTVILRSPYVDAEGDIENEELTEIKLVEYKPWLDHGYAVVYQHCRGRGKSTGDCIPFINEREDGLFLQDWIRKQPFYNGELYLFGHSYKAAVHFVTAPFADDIKGAVLKGFDSERYNGAYRNGCYKIGLFGGWYVQQYKKKSIPEKNYTDECYNMLPLSDFSKKVFGEEAEAFDEMLKHPNRDDDFWKTRYGGIETHHAIDHANIPILLVTGFYDIFTGGLFDMWNALDNETKSKCALVVHPFTHGCKSEGQPIVFEDGNIYREIPDFSVKWFDAIRKNGTPPFEKGKVTYYKLFDQAWCCDDFYTADKYEKIVLGEGTVTYQYDPDDPATFKGGLSANFGGNVWQDTPNLRSDIITLYTPEFTEDAYVKGKIRAKLTVKTNCEDTCFYVRISVCKPEGDYGLRDDINQISNLSDEYIPNTEVEMDFSFDEHAFVIKRGEKLRIDISSSAFPLYVRHTNNKGLFTQQTTTRIADNSVDLEHSYIELPISE